MHIVGDRKSREGYGLIAIKCKTFGAILRCTYSYNIPIRLGGSASFPGNAAAKRTFSRVHGPCTAPLTSVLRELSQWRCLPPTSPRLLACADDRFWVSQSTGQSWKVKMSLRVRDSVSHCERKRAN